MALCRVPIAVGIAMADHQIALPLVFHAHAFTANLLSAAAAPENDYRRS
jgi:hypothetical protein